MIIDLLYDKRCVITFSDFDEDLCNWKDYQLGNFWPKGKPFYWKVNSVYPKSNEWIKINALKRVKLKSIDIAMNGHYDRYEIWTSVNNIDWELLTEGTLWKEDLPEREFIFLRINFYGVQEFLEIRKLHIFVEDSIEFDKKIIHHNILTLLPESFRLKNPNFTEITKAFLKMLETNTVQKLKCYLEELELDIQVKEFKVPPEIKEIRWLLNGSPVPELYRSGVYELEFELSRAGKVQISFSSNDFIIERISDVEFKVKVPDKPGDYQMKVIVSSDGLFTTLEGTVEIK